MVSVIAAPILVNQKKITVITAIVAIILIGIVIAAIVYSKKDTREEQAA